MSKALGGWEEEILPPKGRVLCAQQAKYGVRDSLHQANAAINKKAKHDAHAGMGQLGGRI